MHFYQILFFWFELYFSCNLLKFSKSLFDVFSMLSDGFFVSPSVPHQFPNVVKHLFNVFLVPLP